jgi:dTDP-4-dehydrorhamnose reductase
MNTLLLTGGTGQLARAIARLAPQFAPLGYTVRLAGRPEVDFDHPDSVERCFRDADPALVINAAAWTAVDAAEVQREAAARANDSGPALLGDLCDAAAIPYIHVSTDYVFDGTKGAPYVETDTPHPTGIYGATKLAGENKILTRNPRATVLRTSWVYAAEGKNFVRTMLAAARKGQPIRVVADQRGCPTNADDLAAAVLSIVVRIRQGWRETYGGVFHAAGTGDVSWYEFALAIFAAASRRGLAAPNVTPIATAEWPTPAKRPADSRLDCGKLENVFGVRLPDWQPSLDRAVETIYRAGLMSP